MQKLPDRPISPPSSASPKGDQLWQRSLWIAACAPIVAVLIALLVVVLINLAYPHDPGAGYILLFTLTVLVPVTISSMLVFGVQGLVGYARGRHRPDEPRRRADGDSSHGVAEPIAAGFWRRSAAAMIDWFSLNLLAVMVGYMVETTWQFRYQVTRHQEGHVFDIAYAAACITLPWLYFTLLEASRLQGTPGKLILRIAVTDLDLSRVSFARANVRYWAKLLSVLSLLTGFFICAVTRRRQALHDMLARCLVVRKR